MIGLGRYEKPEYERRFLLAEMPHEVRDPRRITDRYIRNTRLRLRKMEDPAGGNEILKLGHKRRPNPSDPTLVMHTSMYLAPAEYTVLAGLAADELVKKRYRLDHGGQDLAVDVFGAELSGLVLLEAAFADEESMNNFLPPTAAGTEVSKFEGFCGGSLAKLNAAGYLEMLAAID